jgi:hypothetical protein
MRGREGRCWSWRVRGEDGLGDEYRVLDSGAARGSRVDSMLREASSRSNE